MSDIRKHKGRRRFLKGAIAAGGLGIALQRGGGLLAPVLAAASGTGADAGRTVGGDSHQYGNLLSPIRLGNVMVKNRMIQTPSIPRNLVGPENISADQMIEHFANIAKNGCGICFVEGLNDTEDEAANRYHAQMLEAMHFGGALVCAGASHAAEGPMPAGPGMPGGGGGGVEYAIGNRTTMWNGDGKLQRETPATEIPEEMIQEMIEETAVHAKFLKSFGYDAILFGMSYRKSMLAQALSPVLNTRKDKYGGSLENRAQLALEMFTAVKKACGEDFLIIANMSGEEVGEGGDGSYSGGYTTKDAAEYARVWENVLDILVVRGWSDNESHPTSFNFPQGDPPILQYAAAIKKGGAKVAVAPNGGFRDPNKNEAYLAAGKADMIAMARNWIAEPAYAAKLAEGRGEDVTPCLLCNECHTHGRAPWVAGCTVNPKMGIAHRLPLLIDAPTAPRKVAVVGGGPAGMKAAVTAAERGHRVTLYEKTESLGGQLKMMDHVSFKWTFKEFRDNLVRQVEKNGITVHLRTKATSEMLKKEGYDVVLAALGSTPNLPEIPGAAKGSVMAPIYAHGNKTLGKNVVIIGGDQIGTETGMYLAQEGRRVTVLAAETGTSEATETVTPFDASEFYLTSERWQYLGDAFRYIVGTTVKEIDGDTVVYTTGDGKEYRLAADSIVVSEGRNPRLTEAMTFSCVAGKFNLVGDCSIRGGVVRKGIRKAMRSAFAAASEI